MAGTCGRGGGGGRLRRFGTVALHGTGLGGLPAACCSPASRRSLRAGCVRSAFTGAVPVGWAQVCVGVLAVVVPARVCGSAAPRVAPRQQSPFIQPPLWCALAPPELVCVCCVGSLCVTPVPHCVPLVSLVLPPGPVWAPCRVMPLCPPSLCLGRKWEKKK